MAHDVGKLIVLAYPGPQDRTTEVLGLDFFLEALEDPDLIVKVQAQNPPNLDSALRVVQRMAAVFQMVHTRASKLVRIVSDGPVGPVVGKRARDPWMEQLTKAVQHLNQPLSQAKDPALGSTVVCNDPPAPPANRCDRGPNRQVGPTKTQLDFRVNHIT